MPIQIRKKVTVPFTEPDGSDTAGAGFTAHERASFDVAQRSSILMAKSSASTDVVEIRTAMREAEEILVSGSLVTFYGVIDEDGTPLPVSKWRELPTHYANQLLNWLLTRNRQEFAPDEAPNPNGERPSEQSSKAEPSEPATSTPSEPISSSSVSVSPTS